MKNFYKSLKPMADSNLPESEIRKGKLYIAYLNRALIDISSTDARYKASLFTALNGTHYNSDGIPTILSPEDEMMLYDEELSEYY